MISPSVTKLSQFTTIHQSQTCCTHSHGQLLPRTRAHAAADGVLQAPGGGRGVVEGTADTEGNFDELVRALRDFTRTRK